MLINEKHLSLVDPQARKYLQQEMDKFLAGEDHDRAEGYVPPQQ
ncbi:MAG: Fe(2+)-trafficking protein, partial [Pseudomonadales bacterium]|nr:Fe(2+)-trafficking protein [Pseudomonadales bacterium]